VRNKSEKIEVDEEPEKSSYRVYSVRWVREETSFIVEAKSQQEADSLANSAIACDECDWEPDWEYGTEIDDCTVDRIDP